MSSASEPEGTGKGSSTEPEATVQAVATIQGSSVSEGEEHKAGGEVGGAKQEKPASADSVVYNIHLCLPGVPQPVDVVVNCPEGYGGGFRIIQGGGGLFVQGCGVCMNYTGLFIYWGGGG